MVRLTLRLPFDIHAELTYLAKKEDRSLQGQIIHIIKKYLENLKNSNKLEEE